MEHVLVPTLITHARVQAERGDYKELCDADKLARLDPGCIWKCFLIDRAVALLCITAYFPLSRTPELLLSLHFTTAQPNDLSTTNIHTQLFPNRICALMDNENN